MWKSRRNANANANANANIKANGKMLLLSLYISLLLLREDSYGSVSAFPVNTHINMNIHSSSRSRSRSQSVHHLDAHPDIRTATNAAAASRCLSSIRIHKNSLLILSQRANDDDDDDNDKERDNERDRGKDSNSSSNRLGRDSSQQNIDRDRDRTNRDRDGDLITMIMTTIQEKKNIDPLEIRLDATLASCYGLCRFLIYDISTGAKDTPGWELNDLILLGGAFSSCIVLSLLWSTLGVFTGIFNFNNDGYDGGDDYDWNWHLLWNVVSTAAIVGPLWLFVKISCGWPPGGIIAKNSQFAAADFDYTYSVTTYDLYLYFYTIVTGTVGLASVMSPGKILTSGRGRR